MRISDWSSDVCSSDLLALVNDDNLFPIQAPGSTWTFDDNGIFQSGVLTQSSAGGYASPFGGIPMESLRFQRGSDAKTEDLSIDVDFEVTDRLRVNFEAQHISSNLRSEAHTSELQSLMPNSYAVFCLKKKNTEQQQS